MHDVDVPKISWFWFDFIKKNAPETWEIDTQNDSWSKEKFLSKYGYVAYPFVTPMMGHSSNLDPWHHRMLLKRDMIPRTAKKGVKVFTVFSVKAFADKNIPLFLAAVVVIV